MCVQSSRFPREAVLRDVFLKAAWVMLTPSQVEKGAAPGHVYSRRTLKQIFNLLACERETPFVPLVCALGGDPVCPQRGLNLRPRCRGDTLSSRAARTAPGAGDGGQHGFPAGEPALDWAPETARPLRWLRRSEWGPRWGRDPFPESRGGGTLYTPPSLKAEKVFS